VLSVGKTYILKYIDKIMAYNVDLHTYGWPTFERGKFELPGISYRGERSLKVLVDRCSEVDLDLIGFVNFGDTRFQQLCGVVKDLPSNYQVDIHNKRENPVIITVQAPGKKPVIILRGQQMLAQEGHVLVLGASKQLADRRHLEDTLKEAKDLGCLIIAPAPYFMQGKNVEGVTPGSAEYRSPIAIEDLRNTFEGCLRFFDGVETFSASPWPKSFRDLFRLQRQNKDSALFADQYDLPSITVSEAHALAHLGYAYMSFTKPIDPKNVVKDLRKKLSERDYTTKQTTVPLLGMGRCLAADLWNHFSLARGWLTIRRE